MPEIEAAGARLVSISPMVTKYAQPLVKKLGLTYPLLSDPGCRYLEKLGVVFDLPTELIEIYRGFGIDLERFNGDTRWRLPLVGRIIVDSAGIVRDTRFHADHTERPDPAESLAILKGM